MTTSNRIAPGVMAPTGKAPMSTPAAPAAPVAPVVQPAPTQVLIRATLARVISRAAANALAHEPDDAANLWVVGTALVADMQAKDWPSVALDIELLLNAVGAKPTADDRAALVLALEKQFETAPVTDPSPPTRASEGVAKA